MENVILTTHLILALLMIGSVLLQRSEGGALGMGGGGGGGAVSGRSAATALTKVTWILATGFIITSIALTLISVDKSAGGSVIDQFGGTPPVVESQPLAAPSGDVLNTPIDAPAAPPRADAPTADPASN
ncbi:MAG: preprotein translocase subunit SecG [Paracoccaceae bacterium]|jgi:preprotein translocase subunit SecG